jgi:MFS family permease
MRKLGFILSISLFWLVLSVLSDGINTLLLPDKLLHLSSPQTQATTLGLLTFVGLLAGMIIQPVAGSWSDRLRPRYGRKVGLALGTAVVLIELIVFGVSPGLIGLALGYFLIQVSLSIIQDGCLWLAQPVWPGLPFRRAVVYN